MIRNTISHSLLVNSLDGLLNVNSPTWFLNKKIWRDDFQRTNMANNS